MAGSATGYTSDATNNNDTSGRWARVGGMPSSSASTLVPGMSPAVTPAVGAGADFGSVSARINNDDNNDDDIGSNVSNIPTPLDLSAIPVAAPPFSRNGGKFGSSAGSSASKSVVLQGAALESLKRLGGPGSSVSDRSNRSNGSNRSKGTSSARGARMTVPLGSAVPMGVSLGSVASSVGSDVLLSQRQQKQVGSANSIGKDFHSTGSVVVEETDPVGKRMAGWGWANSGSGVSSRGNESAAESGRLPANAVRLMFEVRGARGSFGGGGSMC